MSIDLKTKETPIIEKTRELCETIVEQPMFQKILADIEAFLADNQARSVYESLIEKQQFLIERQQQGHELTEAEIADYESERDVLMGNTVATAFIEAREQIQKVQNSIGQYVSKTFELGKVPTEDELSSGGGGGCCGGGGGGGCGCS